MGKCKPRHNPDKKQNNHGGICSYYEYSSTGHAWCEISLGDVKNMQMESS